MLMNRLTRSALIAFLPLLSLLTGSARAAPPSPPSTASTQPASIPRNGLALWLTAEDAVVENGKVTQIKDRSGAGRHAAQISHPKLVATNPKVVKHEQAGRLVLRFDGSLTGYSFEEIRNIRTVFWVVSKETAAFKTFHERFVLGGARTREFHVGAHWTDTVIELGFHKHLKLWFNGIASDPSLTEFAPKLAVISMVSSRDTSADQLARDRDFVDRSWHGDIAEILLYTTALSDADRQAVEKHLMTKYGIEPFEPVVVARETVLPGHTKPPPNAGKDNGSNSQK